MVGSRWQGTSSRYLGDLYTESGQTLQGSFSAVSTPIFASKYALESSLRDLHNALLCTVLVGSVWVKKYTKINIEKMKSGKFSNLNFFVKNRQTFLRLN